MSTLKKWDWATYIPISPTFTGFKCFVGKKEKVSDISLDNLNSQPETEEITRHYILESSEFEIPAEPVTDL